MMHVDFMKITRIYELSHTTIRVWYQLGEEVWVTDECGR